jgi:hypothetical protein
MKRSVFLVIAGIIATFFGAGMIFNPSQMLNMIPIETNQSTRVVLQWMGCPMIAIGLMNIMARKDPGGPALRAILLANILLHFFGACVDAYDFTHGFINNQGIIMGSVIHLGFIAGFLFYLSKTPKSA